MSDLAKVDLALTLRAEREIFDRLAPRYRDLLNGWGLNYRCERADFVAWILETLRESDRPMEGLRFLDAGCGTGELLEGLRDAGCSQLVGLDLSSGMLAKTRHFVPEAQLVRGTIEEHPFPADSFDVVVSAFSVHHLFDPRAFFRMVERVLRRDGCFFVLEYHRESWAVSGWQAQAIRVLTAPARLLVQAKNRQRGPREELAGYDFNPVHKLWNVEEFAELIAACELRSEIRTHGALGFWFNRILMPDSGLDRAIQQVVRFLDRLSWSRRGGGFQWIAGAPPGGETPGRAGTS